MSTTNIQLKQIDIIKQVLNVSDIRVLDRLKAFIANCKKDEELENINGNYITAELQKEIDEARQEYKRGETLHFNGATEAQKWMDAL